MLLAVYIGRTKVPSPDRVVRYMHMNVQICYVICGLTGVDNCQRMQNTFAAWIRYPASAHDG